MKTVHIISTGTWQVNCKLLSTTGTWQCTKSQQECIICWEQKSTLRPPKWTLFECTLRVCPWWPQTALAESYTYWKPTWLTANVEDTATRLPTSQQLNWWVKCYQNICKWWQKLQNKATKWSDWILVCGCSALHSGPVLSDVCLTRSPSGLQA